MTDFKKRILGKGKKFYTEVLERRTVSDKLPVFQKMRTGTEIFIMIDCQVKCNTIREKNFEAPRRESEN